MVGVRREKMCATIANTSAAKTPMTITVNAVNAIRMRDPESSVPRLLESSAGAAGSGVWRLGTKAEVSGCFTLAENGRLLCRFRFAADQIRNLRARANGGRPPPGAFAGLEITPISLDIRQNAPLAI